MMDAETQCNLPDVLPSDPSHEESKPDINPSKLAVFNKFIKLRGRPLVIWGGEEEKLKMD